MEIGISKNYAKLFLLKMTTDSQIMKFVEESSELNQQLMKYLLYRENPDWKGKDNKLKSKIQSEIADVIITLSTMIEIFDQPDNDLEDCTKIDKFITFKLLRLMDRLKE